MGLLSELLWANNLSGKQHSQIRYRIKARNKNGEIEYFPNLGGGAIKTKKQAELEAYNLRNKGYVQITIEKTKRW